MSSVYLGRVTGIARWLSRINSLLSVIIFLGCIAIIAMPFWSSIHTQVKKMQDQTQGIIYESRLAESLNVDRKKLKAIPGDNRLVIPKILVDGPISEGSDKKALEEGYWRRTPTISPEDNNNMVIAGHRNIFAWTLYDLDKLAQGDIIIIYWKGEEYNYKVEKIFTVTPSQIEIEAPTQDKQLTLYTCTPLLTAADRLVVVAKPFVI